MQRVVLYKNGANTIEVTSYLKQMKTRFSCSTQEEGSRVLRVQGAVRDELDAKH